MSKFRVVIPVRYASTRLPGKPLLDYAGKSILEHVYLNATASSAKSVLIATDDQRILAAAEDFGANVCMTSTEHLSGTDRIAEAVHKQAWPDDEIIVNLQGDEPEMPAENIDQVAQLLHNHVDAAIATLCARLINEEDYVNPNVVKVTKDCNGKALYFSRSPIPFNAEVTAQKLQAEKYYRHIGIYAYRVRYLQQFVAEAQSSLEQLERLEQLRALERGDAIVVAECLRVPGIGIDTPDDYANLCQKSSN